jgi:pimeloyl-ACP methyl ester carboxylesterase
VPTFDVEEAEIHYQTFGHGSPLLLVSGTACSGEVWKKWQVPEFSRDHTVIVFDQRGTGRTKTRLKDYSTSRLAADAAGLIRRIGLGPAVVWGHSMGGRVAQLIALDHPDCAKRLVLASTGASFRAKGGIPIAICLELLDKGYERYVREHIVEVGFSKRYVEAHPALVQEFIDLRFADLPPVEVLLGHVAARQEHDTSGRLQDIRVPTLVIVGGDEDHGLSDTTHVESSRRLAEGIPNAKFVVIEGAGHYYQVSDPETTNRAVREFIS